MAYGTVNADVIGTSVTGSNLGAGNATRFKNRIINGAMVIDQRNAGASVTPTVDGTYTLDRFYVSINTASKFSVQQNAGSVTPPAGYINYLGVTSLAATTVGSGDYYQIRHSVEGLNVADLGWGTSDAKTVTLSFWVRSSLTGTFSVALFNSGENRFYPSTYTISTANTWTQAFITVSGDTTGTWLKTNGKGITVNFGLGLGSTYTTSSANAWTGTAGYGVSSAVNVVSTNGATWYITGVQLEVGSSATGFDYRDYGTELIMCQRYYSTSYPYGVALQSSTNPTDGANFICINTSDSGNGGPLPVTMRVTPTFAAYSTNGSVSSPSARYGASGANVTVNLVGGTTTNLPRLSTASLLGTQGAPFNAHWTASAEL